MLSIPVDHPITNYPTSLLLYMLQEYLLIAMVGQLEVQSAWWASRLGQSPVQIWSTYWWLRPWYHLQPLTYAAFSHGIHSEVQTFTASAVKPTAPATCHFMLVLSQLLTHHTMITLSYCGLIGQSLKHMNRSHQYIQYSTGAFHCMYYGI